LTQKQIVPDNFQTENMSDTVVETIINLKSLKKKVWKTAKQQSTQII